MARTPTYIIDACSVDRLKRLSNSNLGWSILIRLIEQGRLLMVEQALVEVQNVDPPAYNRLNVYREQILIRISPELFAEAGRISETYRRMSRPRHPNDSADPWIVAAAKRSGCVVVTNEKKRRQRIPVVCEREQVQCISLEQLVEAEAWTTMIGRRRLAPILRRHSADHLNSTSQRMLSGALG